MAFDALRVILEAANIGMQHLASQRGRVSYYTSMLTGKGCLQEVINGHPDRCYAVLKMPKNTFFELCNVLETKYGWVAYRDNAVRVEESLAIFICVLRW